MFHTEWAILCGTKRCELGGFGSGLVKSGHVGSSRVKWGQAGPVLVSFRRVGSGLVDLAYEWSPLLHDNHQGWVRESGGICPSVTLIFGCKRVNNLHNYKEGFSLIVVSNNFCDVNIINCFIGVNSLDCDRNLERCICNPGYVPDGQYCIPGQGESFGLVCFSVCLSWVGVIWVG